MLCVAEARGSLFYTAFLDSQKVYLLRTVILSRNFGREKNQPLKLLEVYVINK